MIGSYVCVNRRRADARADARESVVCENADHVGLGPQPPTIRKPRRDAVEDAIDWRCADRAVCVGQGTAIARSEVDRGGDVRASDVLRGEAQLPSETHRSLLYRVHAEREQGRR